MTRQTLVLTLALLFFTAPASGEHFLRYSTIIEGGLSVAGNTLGLSNGPSENGPGTRDSIGTFISLDSGAVDGPPTNPANPWPGGTTSDWSQNGSSAFLDIPDDKDSEVMYAELVWGGSHRYLAENVTAALNTPVTLTFDGESSITVTPEPGDTEITLNETAIDLFEVNYYVRSGIVTDFVAEHGAGSYSASGIPATQDEQVNSLNAGGWVLIVAFANAANSPTPRTERER